MAARNYWGRRGVAPVVCTHVHGEDLKLLLDRIRHYFAQRLDSEEYREIIVILETQDQYESQADDLGAPATRLVVGTPDQLLRDWVDFGPYLESLTAIFDDSVDGLASYYVRPVSAADSDIAAALDLEDELTSWIEAKSTTDGTTSLDPARPVAVLGAYGIGKSSLATRLASQLAKKALAQQGNRIPVLIRLSELSGEQDLEGLLGKHFGATHQVMGYSFAAFQELNRRGHLVVILDGFDEMKQLLTWREFVLNLEQLNRLQCGEDSRVIILGRPTAFENDFEYQHALHGKRRRGDRFVEEAGWPNFQAIRIAPLDPKQIEQFVDDYLRYCKSPIVSDARRLRLLREQLQSPELKDIVPRPVQLRMLIDILPDYEGSIDDLNVSRVYEIFLHHLIEEIMLREEKKRSRLAYSRVERRDFLKEFAWWLWNLRETPMVTTDMIPETLIRPFIHGRDAESVRRDLVAASPLDRRHGERVGFPHRSIQEFLVAEKIWELLKADEIGLAEVDDLINREVADFMMMQQGSAQKALAQRLLPRLESPIRLQTCKSIFLNDQVVSGLHARMLDRGRGQPLTDAELLMISLWTMQRKLADHAISVEDIQRVQGPSVLLKLACALLVNDSARRHDPLLVRLIGEGARQALPPERVTAQGVSTGSVIPLDDVWVARHVRSGINVGKIQGRGRIRMNNRNGRQEIVFGAALPVSWMTDLALSIRQKCRIVKGETVLDVRELLPSLVALLAKGPFVSDWLRNDTLDSTVLGRTDFTLAPNADIRAAIAELESVDTRVSRAIELGKIKAGPLRGAQPQDRG
ncbi:NACHT domain-containing protein [Streptomyces sp. SudanB148_2056]|uniref:NACHT domain-containing protein n=1 Tax=Streptomyces sp. SudanB148_2056 TaxID=3035280 RepID=UPI003F57FECD